MTAATSLAARDGPGPAGLSLHPPVLADGLPVPRRLAAIAALCCGTALVILDGSIANVALPTIARDLGVPSSSAVATVTIYQLLLVMLMLPLAGLGERIGLKRVYQAGQVVFTVATAFCFLADSLPMLLLMRAGQAIGAAGSLGVASALIRQTYPRRQLGRGLGLNAVIVTSAAAAAPTLGGFILSIAPWPWVYASAVPFAIASLLLGRALPDRRPGASRFDFAGAVVCAAMFGLIVGGTEGAVQDNRSLMSWLSIAVGAIVGVGYVRRERRIANPILPVDLLARPVIALSAVGGYAAFIASMTLLLSTPFRLTQAFGFTPVLVGAAIAPWPLVNIVVAPLAGFLSDRVPAGVLGGVGMTVSTGGLLLIANLPAHAILFDVAWRMALCGSGFGLFLPPNGRLIIGSAPLARMGAAGGLVSTVRLLGQTTGATVVALLLKLGLGTGAAPALVAVALTVTAGLCSLSRLRPALRESGDASGGASPPTLHNPS